MTVWQRRWRSISYNMDKELFEKMDCFFDTISKYNAPAVAFSGGIDSTLLAVAANKLFPGLPCIILVSALLSQEELTDARKIAREHALNLVEIESDELLQEDIAINSPERCFYCKKYRFELICAWIEKHGHDIIFEGSNLDDLSDYRPGMKALSQAPKVCSPLLESGFKKGDVRALANEWRIRIWNKPSASCLATRVDYGNRLSPEILAKIDAAENIIRKHIPANSNLRVRLHSDIARIETDTDNFAIIMQPHIYTGIAKAIRQLGLSFVTLDLCGFKSGNMNRNI